jgi:oxygen-independent coproporphyrinogen-3 oxidase
VCRRWAEKGFILYEKLANFLQNLRLVGRGWIFMDDIVTDLANSYSNLE